MSIKATVLRAATAISPKLSDTLRFLYHYRRLPSWDNPSTFPEKLLVLKQSYRDDPTIIQCADKYRVREYVSSRGCGEYLNEVYATCDLGSTVNWDELPRRFAMKLNTGAGHNYFCDSKDDEIPAMEAVLSSWRNLDHDWLVSAELQYEKIVPMVLFEKYLDIHHEGSIEDYKFYCFGGEPRAILLMSDRYAGEGGIKELFVTPAWDVLGTDEADPSVRPLEELPPAPPCLEEMADAARRLSAGWPFVRVDFYVVGGRPVFGEMTFTPKSCIGTAETHVSGVPMGDLIKLSD